MRIVLWILQVLLAALFVWHGLLFLNPPAEMVEMMNAMIPAGLRMFIGLAELLAAAGLILPAATRILPWLTPLAGVGLIIVMASATVFHLSRGEFSNIIFTLVILALVAFVAYMRWKKFPITPRTA